MYRERPRRTISVDGDGGFQMNIQERETLARLRLPVKFFVVNNQGYGSIARPKRTGSDDCRGRTRAAG